MRCAIAAMLLAGAAASACGYSLAGRGSFLPAYIRTIGVPQFINHTTVFDVERRVTERVRSELLGRGKYKVLPTEIGNDAVLTGEILSIAIQPLAFTQQNQGARYVLVMTAKVEFKDLKTGKVIWANPVMQFRDEFEPATVANVGDASVYFGQDQNALERLATEFARSVVSALLEAF
jgi:Lipopolysaccharide-assembly